MKMTMEHGWNDSDRGKPNRVVEEVSSTVTVKVKVKLEQGTKVQRGSRGIAILLRLLSVGPR
jgi:hypothetical protein